MNFSVRALRLLATTHDFCAVALCWYLAYLLRFNLNLPPGLSTECLKTLPFALLPHLIAYRQFGLYRGIWRYASLRDLLRIIVAVAFGALVTTCILYMLQPLDNLRQVPRSVLVLHPLLLILFMGGSRFIYRLAKDWRQYGHLGQTGEWVLVIGAGHAGARLAYELQGSSEWQVAAFLDDDFKKHGQEIHGIRVRGPIREIARWAAELEIQYAIIAMPGMPQQVRQTAIEQAIQAGLKVMTVPSAEDLLSERITISRLRRVSLEDLLQRDAVQMDEIGLAEMFSGKTVLVTGAGGSIGSELVRQIARFRPCCLVLYEHSEFALFRIEQEFQSTFPDLAIRSIIGDVKDETRLTRVFETFQPAYVFHAAAYKHVPLMETDNAREAVLNNVLGTRAVARAAARHGVRKMVLISTDKAVNPVNVMGATKRLSEMLLATFPNDASSTHFIAVRFGNVLGSNGSVIPTFHAQIEKGGPVTVTHPDIIRYFMLTQEAVQLVLQAALMGQGGEVFVLDMGAPVRILDLARDMILLSGHTEAEIPIEITGLRLGEKLYEELLASDETSLPTPHDKLRISRSTAIPSPEWLAELEHWLANVPDDSAEVRKGLQKMVPEYLFAHPASDPPLQNQ